MSELSHFKSRSGRVSCTAGKIYVFVTDIRNFKRFIPQGTVIDWKAERDSCSFSVSMIGTVYLNLVQKEMYHLVVYNGNALMKNEFELILHITDHKSGPAD